MSNSLSYKTKQFFWLIIKLSIVIGCFYFISKRIIANKELSFSVFYKNLIDNGIFLLKNCILLLLFSFLNWFLEIKKWNLLASFCIKISMKSAAIQSLASLTASLVTPNRIGEYGAKALYFKKPYRKQIVGLNLVGNFYQMLMTIIFGIVGFSYFAFAHKIELDFQRFFKALLLGLCFITALFFGLKHFNYKGYSTEKARIFIRKIPFKLNLNIGILSLLRFVIFSHQFYFLLLLFKLDIPYLNAISAIATVYFISSIVPMLSLFDVVLKGSIAIWVFSYFEVEPITIIAITTIMWILNFVIPAIFGSYFVIIFKPNFTK